MNKEQSKTWDLGYESYTPVRIWSGMLVEGVPVLQVKYLVERHIEALLNHHDSDTAEFVAATHHSKHFLSTLIQQENLS